MNEECLPLKKAIEQDGCLKVHVITMPLENPWFTRKDWEDQKKRDTRRFQFTIAALIVSIVSMAATAIIAIETIITLSTVNKL